MDKLIIYKCKQNSELVEAIQWKDRKKVSWLDNYEGSPGNDDWMVNHSTSVFVVPDADFESKYEETEYRYVDPAMIGGSPIVDIWVTPAKDKIKITFANGQVKYQALS